MMDARRLWMSGWVLAFSAAAASAEIKVLLCPGDYGMWAQDRAKRIIEAVNKTAPGKAVFEVEQSYSFGQKFRPPAFTGVAEAIGAG